MSRFVVGAFVSITLHGVLFLWLNKNQKRLDESISVQTPIEIVIAEDVQKDLVQAQESKSQNKDHKERLRHTPTKNYRSKVLGVKANAKTTYSKARVKNKDREPSRQASDQTLSPPPLKVKTKSNILGFTNKGDILEKAKGSHLDLKLPNHWGGGVKNKSTNPGTQQTSLQDTQHQHSLIPKTWKRRRNGTYIVNKPGFEITVKEDGSVTFKDDPDFTVKIALPTLKSIKKDLKDWFKNPEKYRKNFESNEKLFTFIEDDFQLLFKGPAAASIIPILAGGFNPDTFIMRQLGEDPFLAARLKFMKETRHIRFKMATDTRKNKRRNARFHAKRRLKQLWDNKTLSAQYRRAMLFELWDESNETPDGLFIKKSIVGFVNKELPKHSNHAFTFEEINRYNKTRQSTTRFAPYL